MSHNFNGLIVERVVKETDDSSSIYFTIPDELKSEYLYKAGQYLTLKFDIRDKEYRRSYSICTSPNEDLFGVNVKRVKKGIVSNYINDNVVVGNKVEVMEPDGKFTIDLNPNSKRDFYFFASGSGITPIISIIKTILEDEPKSCCYLCYGNTNEDSIIFKSELDDLRMKYDGQFFLRHTLSQPKREKEKGFKGMFSRGKLLWEGWRGRIDKEKIEKFREENPVRSKEAHYFVCGPGAMIDTILDHIETTGIEKEFLHTEYFISSAVPDISVLEGVVRSRVKVHLAGSEIEVEVPPEKTILEVLIENKFDPPYSCTSGACSTCVAKLISGKIEMDACYALDDDEVSAGYILVCQSRAKTEEVELQFES